MEILTKNIFLEISQEKENKVFKLSDGIRKISLNSSNQPQLKAKEKISKYPIHSSKLIFLIGFGSGYELEEIIKLKKEDTDIVIFEPDYEIFDKIVDERNLNEIIKKNTIKIYTKENLNEFSNDFDPSKKEILSSNPIIIENSVYRIFYPEFVNDIHKEIEKLIEIERCIYETKKITTQNIAKNISENFKYLIEAPDVSNLFGIFKNNPAIIVSAGPSLKKHLKLLKQAQNKAIIIAVDTVLRVLLKENINPDLVVSIDFTPKNYKHFEGLNTSKSIFVFDFQVYSKCIEHHFNCGGSFFRSINIHPLCEFLSSYTLLKGELPLGGSTSHAALHLAVRMGANPITLIGQDLAFSENQTHCDGVATKKEIKHSLDLIEVEGYNAGKVKTSSSLFTILKDFEKIIDSYKDVNIFNSTEGGALIKNAKNIPFSKFIELYCKNELNPKQKIEKLIKKESFFDYLSFTNKLNFFIPRISRISLLAIKAKKTLNEIIDAIAEKDINKIKENSNKMKSIYKQIQEDLELTTILYSDIEHLIYSLKIEENSKNLGHELLSEVIKEITLFDNILNSSINLKKIFLKIKNDIKFKNIEKDPSHHFKNWLESL